MSDRITEHQLMMVVDRINQITNSPRQPWTKNDDRKFHGNIGCYFLDFSYGGVALVRMHNEQGGEESIIGRGTKRELYDRMQAFISGLTSKQLTRRIP